ncbi:MAG: NUDIX hydrolase [Cytophagales bacterium]|nr:NUDIX hydrolase [Cytophagales bacterium]MDW8384954.1 NUDIX hydrolase [Flammeovirgaceae bacterium]
MEISNATINTFGKQLRVRVCGILLENNKVLMACHRSITKKGDFWCPPGGGVQYGESLNQALKREFQEETGLQVHVKKYLTLHEFLEPPLHAIELFFEVEKVSGILKTGEDPEISSHQQILKEVKFLSLPEIHSFPKETYHKILHHIQNFEDLFSLPAFLI